MKLTKFKPRDWIDMVALLTCVFVLSYIVGVAAYAIVMP